MPKLYLIAGCNGCGKTTFMNSPEYLRAVTQFNPDAEFAARGTWRDVASRLRDILASKQDLVLETTLSGKTILKHIAQAKKDGYELHITFIGTDDPAVNIARIETRIALGGHHISDTDVNRRWHTSLANLPSVMAIADSTLILDNSLPQKRANGAFRTLARIQNNEVHLDQDPPEWATAGLPSIFKSKEQGR